jgi:hypothetical protein
MSSFRRTAWLLTTTLLTAVPSAHAQYFGSN